MNCTLAVNAPVINDAGRWNLLHRRAQEARAVRAVELMRQHAIDPIVIKGVAAGLYYPQNILRDSIDVDLAVSKADMMRAVEIAGSAAADGFAIDLHAGLRHLDTVAWNDLFENSRLMEVSGGYIRVLRPEDHLRVLCVHWLTDGGADRDRLWDIYYAIENRPADFDWDRFLGVVSKRRQRWLACALGLAHKYLGLDINDTPLAESARNLPPWLIAAVEREWAAETKAVPLEASLKDRSLLFKQIVRRLRPDPIWSTIQNEGDFDARTRIHYQAVNLVRRIPSSYRRISNVIKFERHSRK